jgi:hypothetical protein
MAHRRIRQLLTRRLQDYRAALTAEQQVLFDAKARKWLELE